MALSKTKLKAAVAKYSAENKDEAAIREQLKADGFNEEESNQIYSAIGAPDLSKSYVIAQEFRDINDFSKVYKVDDPAEAADFGSDKRFTELIESGLVKEAQED